MALGFSAPIRADYNCLNFSVVDHIWGEASGGFQTAKRTQEFSQAVFKCLVLSTLRQRFPIPVIRRVYL